MARRMLGPLRLLLLAELHPSVCARQRGGATKVVSPTPFVRTAVRSE